jgi:hypothetical protein
MSLLFQFLLDSVGNCAVIVRRDFLWLHDGDRRGGIFGRPLFVAVECHCYLVLLFLEHTSTVIILQ